MFEDINTPQLKPLRPLTQVVSALLFVDLCGDLAAIVSRLSGIQLLSTGVAGEQGNHISLHAIRLQPFDILISAASLATIVCFLLWIYRAYRNLTALGVRRLQFTPAWAVAFFFVPLLNLFIPYQVVTDIWKASSPELTDVDRVAALGQVDRAPWLIAFWWAALIGPGVLNAANNFISLGSETPVVALHSVWWAAGSDVLNIIAALLCIVVMRQITARQRERASRVARAI